MNRTLTPSDGDQATVPGKQNHTPPRAAVRPRPRHADSASHGWQHRQARGRTQKPWWRGSGLLIGAVVLVLAVIGAFIGVASQSGSGNTGPLAAPASATILRAVEAINPSIIATVGTGQLTNPLSAISGPSLTTDGKPEVLYIGGDFCPVCAAGRWSLINALSRFGTFSRLRYMRSAANDGNLATFTFHGSSYTSPYVSLVAIENEDRAGKLLDPLSPEQQQLLTTLGGNGFPFVDIAGRFVNRTPTTSAAGFPPTVLSGKNWSQIAAALNDARDPVTQGIVGSANYLTAALCLVTHSQPRSVCTSPTIRQIEPQLR